jgi:hypothetical protein
MGENLDKKVAEGMYAGLEYVIDYMEKRVKPGLNLFVGRQSAREQYMLGLYYLAKGWLHTLKKLDEPRDVQAIMACTRSLLEVTVDTIHLHRDKSRKTVRKMLHFDRFQKFKAAAELVKFYGSSSVPSQYEEIESFYKKRKYQVEKKKKELWPNNKSPMRWTGNSLLVDIKTADHMLGYAIEEELRMSLEKFYETEYRRLNWYVHGSGLSGYWNIPANTFHLICGLGFYWSASFAMLCAKVVLTDFRVTTVLTNFDREWDRVRLTRHATFLEHNPHLHSDETVEALEAAKQLLNSGY